MNAAVSPRSYRAAVLEHFTATRTPHISPTSPSLLCSGQEHRRCSDSVVIENSRLMGNLNDSVDVFSFQQGNKIDTSGSTSMNYSSSTRSLVIDFIDHCVMSGVPESLIVEHVMFMVHAMQEQISLTEALHARFHYDRLREYEISELTNMLERQKAYHEQQQLKVTEKKHVVQSLERMEETPQRRNTSLYGGNKNTLDVVGVRTGRSERSARIASGKRHARVACTQTPPEDSRKLLRQTRGGNRGLVTPFFQGFMRPTEASNRKERQKYMVVTEELNPKEQQQRQQQQHYHRYSLQRPTGVAQQHYGCSLSSKKMTTAQRGRLRLMGELKVGGVEHLTWSDEDDSYDHHHHLPSSTSHDGTESPETREVDLKQQQQPKQQEGTSTSFSLLRQPLPPHRNTIRSPDRGTIKGLYEEKDEKRKRDKSADADANAVVPLVQSRTQSVPTVLASAPPLSVKTPSFLPSQELLAYMEQSRRKVQEAERVLANTPGCSSNNRSLRLGQYSDSLSPLSDRLRADTMAERFSVHLMHPDVNAETNANDSGDTDDVTPLLHAEVYVHNPGDPVYHEADVNKEGRASKSIALLTRLYSCAASIVSEVEEGRVFLERHVSEICRREPPAHLQLEGGGRLFLLRPVEGGDFMLVVTIPAGVWRWMGPVTLQILLATAVQGYEIPTNVAAVASVPMYCPLRERIRENADAVEDAVQMRLEQLREFVAFLNECGHQKTALLAAMSQAEKETALIVARMCQERPSPTRTHHRLTFVLQQLLCSATHYSDYCALSGAMSCSGMDAGYKRFVVTSTAVWYHGEPLFSNSRNNDFEACLLPTAIVAYAHRCLSARRCDAPQPPVTIKSVAMHSHGAQNTVHMAGYVKVPPELQKQKENAAAVCVAFVSSGGWLVVLRLERALNLFTGAPMPYIVSGVTDLINKKLETPRFIAKVGELTGGRLLETRHSGTLSQSVYAMNILRVVRELGLFSHSCSGAAAGAAPTAVVSRDVCLYRYLHDNADVVMDAEWGLWQKYIDRAVLHLVELTSQLFWHHHYYHRGCSGVHRSFPFSLLRGRSTVVILLAAPVFRPERKVVFFFAEMKSEGISPLSELRSFAAWMLSKVL